jgi:DNA-directed RNA polymerase subunit M/transcription elongation factor TFIIS
MLICAYCGNQKGDELGCCGENHFDEIRCPNCDSTDVIYAMGFTTTGIETSFIACEMCNHQWGHE